MEPSPTPHWRRNQAADEAGVFRTEFGGKSEWLFHEGKEQIPKCPKRDCPKYVRTSPAIFWVFEYLGIWLLCGSVFIS